MADDPSQGLSPDRLAAAKAFLASQKAPAASGLDPQRLNAARAFLRNGGASGEPPKAPQATISAYTPSLLQRAKQTIANTAIGRSFAQEYPRGALALGMEPSETVHSPTYQEHGEQLISPEYLIPANAHGLAASFTRGALQAGGGLTSAPNLAFLAIPGGEALGLGEVGTRVASRLMAAGFAGQQLVGLLKSTPALYHAVKSGDYEGAAQMLGQMSVGAAVTGILAKHAINGHAVPETPVESEPAIAPKAETAPTQPPVEPEPKTQEPELPTGIERMRGELAEPEKAIAEAAPAEPVPPAPPEPASPAGRVAQTTDQFLRSLSPTERTTVWKWVGADLSGPMGRDARDRFNQMVATFADTGKLSRRPGEGYQGWKSAELRPILKRFVAARETALKGEKPEIAASPTPEATVATAPTKPEAAIPPVPVEAKPTISPVPKPEAAPAAPKAEAQSPAASSAVTPTPEAKTTIPPIPKESPEELRDSAKRLREQAATAKSAKDATDLMRRAKDLEARAQQSEVGAPAPGTVGTMDVSKIEVDPSRFQYKRAAIGKGGVSGKLLEQDKFNPLLAGTLDVWTDPADGKTYVVNGHHRLDLAKRTGAKEVNVFSVQAPDAAAARVAGALHNIAEDQGDAVDAAKVFRESGLTPEDLRKEGISINGKVSAQGLALADLDDQIFDRVQRGEIPVTRAVAIAQATDNPTEQRAILKLAEEREAKGKRVQDDVLAELARMVKGAGTKTESVQTLFGEEQIEKSLAWEKAEVSAYIKRELARERTTFAAVGSEARATRLNEAGNKVNAEQNAQIAARAQQDQELYDRLSDKAGPVEKTLNEAAEKLAKGENADAVKKEAYKRIRQDLQANLGRGNAGVRAELPRAAGEGGGVERAAEKPSQTPAATEELRAIVQKMDTLFPGIEKLNPDDKLGGAAVIAAHAKMRGMSPEELLDLWFSKPEAVPAGAGLEQRRRGTIYEHLGIEPPPPPTLNLVEFPDLMKVAMQAYRDSGGDYGKFAADIVRNYSYDGDKVWKVKQNLKALWRDLNGRAAAPDIGPGGTERTPEQQRDLQAARRDKRQADLFGAPEGEPTEEPPAPFGKGPSQGSLFQKEGVAKGRAEFADNGRAVIRFLDKPDFSTMVHELGHVFRAHLTPEENAAFRKALGLTPEETWKVSDEEMFARQFENYLSKGKAPTPELQSWFGRFKQWLSDIYKSVSGSPLRMRMSPDASRLFAYLMGGEKPEDLFGAPKKLEGVDAAKVPDAILAGANGAAMDELQAAIEAAKKEMMPALEQVGLNQAAPSDALMQNLSTVGNKLWANGVKDEKAWKSYMLGIFGEPVRPYLDEVFRRSGPGGGTLAEGVKSEQPIPPAVEGRTAGNGGSQADRSSAEPVGGRRGGPAEPGAIPRAPSETGRGAGDSASGSATGPGRRAKAAKARAGVQAAAATDATVIKSKLAKVKPLEIAEAEKPWGAPLYEPDHWSGILREANLPEDSPIPTVHLRQDLRERLVDEQPIVAEIALSALEQRGGALIGTPVGSGKCVLPNSMIPTDRGLLTAAELWRRIHGNESAAHGGLVSVPRETVRVASLGAAGVEWKPVVGTYRQFVAEKIKRVTLHDGSQIACTNAHKLRTTEGWSGSIAVGDFAAVPASLPEPQEAVDQDLLELLGWQVTEGWEQCAAEYRSPNGPILMSITQADRGLLEHLRCRFANLADRHGWRWKWDVRKKLRVKRHHVDSYALLIYCREYRRWLESMGYTWGLRSADKRLPAWMFGIPNEQMRHLLRVMFEAEGCPSRRANNIEFVSKSPWIISFVRDGLRRFGVWAVVRPKQVNGQTYWRLWLYGRDARLFADEIGFLSHSKCEATQASARLRGAEARYCTTYHGNGLVKRCQEAGIPEERIGASGTGLSQQRLRDVLLPQLTEIVMNGGYTKRVVAHGKEKKNFAPVNRQKASALLHDLRKWVLPGVAFSRVDCVESDMYDGEVYDFEVADSHNYVCDGMVTHNSYIEAAIISQLQPKRALVLTAGKTLPLDLIERFKDFGLAPKKLPSEGAGPLPAEGLWVANYESTYYRKDLLGQDWDLVIADESDKARNWADPSMEQTGQFVRKLTGKAKKALYLSASPFHTALEAGYLTRLGMWKDGEFLKWAKQFGVSIDANGDMHGRPTAQKMAKLRQQMIELGIYVTSDLDMRGHEVSFGLVEQREKERQAVRAIVDTFGEMTNYYAQRGANGMKHAAQGRTATYLKSFLERARLPQVVDLAKKAVDSGYQVVIYADQFNKSDMEASSLLNPRDDARTGARWKAQLPQLESIPDQLEQAFPGKLVNFSGGGGPAARMEMDTWNRGEKPVMFASYATGGRGVNSHDTSAGGVRPRIAFHLGLPWDSFTLQQAIGRIWRKRTTSDAHSVFLISDAAPDVRLVAQKIGPRLAALRAAVSGMDFDDKLIRGLRSASDAFDQYVDMEFSGAAGKNADFSPEEYLGTERVTGIQPWHEIEIHPASAMMGKGLGWRGRARNLYQMLDDAKVAPGKRPDYGQLPKVPEEAEAKGVDEGAEDGPPELPPSPPGGFGPPPGGEPPPKMPLSPDTKPPQRSLRVLEAWNNAMQSLATKLSLRGTVARFAAVHDVNPQAGEAMSRLANMTEGNVARRVADDIVQATTAILSGMPEADKNGVKMRPDKYNQEWAKTAKPDEIAAARQREEWLGYLIDSQDRQQFAEFNPDEFQKALADPLVQRAFVAYTEADVDAQKTAWHVQTGGKTLPGMHLKRVYAQFTPGLADYERNLELADGEDGAKYWTTSDSGTYYPVEPGPAHAPKFSRKASWEFYRKNGLHEFGARFGPDYTQKMVRYGKLDAWLQASSRSVRTTGELPAKITLDGKDYYSPEAIRRIRDAGNDPHSAESQRLAKSLGIEVTAIPKNPQQYGIYSLAESPQWLRTELDSLERATNRGTASSQIREWLQDAKADSRANYLMPEPVANALRQFAIRDDLSKYGLLRLLGRVNNLMIQQLFRFSMGLPHSFNVTRRSVQATVPEGFGSDLNPYNWAKAMGKTYQGLFRNKEYASKAAWGAMNPDVRAALMSGGIGARSWDAMYNYTRESLAPDRWLHASSDWLFDRGLDERARLYIRDFVRMEHPEKTDYEISAYSSKALGDLQRANWGTVRRWLSAVMPFPTWSFSSLQWVLEHPIKTAAAPAVVAVAMNYASYLAGENDRKHRFDVTSVRVGGRQVYAPFAESWARTIYGPDLRAAQTALEGGSEKQVTANLSFDQYLNGDAGRAIMELGPATGILAGFTFNARIPAKKAPVWEAKDADRPALVLPYSSRKLEKQLAFAISQEFPLLTPIAENLETAKSKRQFEKEIPSGLLSEGGVQVGFQNYPIPPPPRH